MSEQPLIIYALPGSQFVFKVLAAMGSRKIDHFIEFVDLDPKKRKLPSGGLLLPELQLGVGEDKVIITDSENILHWLDDNKQTNFFPNDAASEISKRASDKTLAAMVWYYNWVDDGGYEKSMRQLIGEKYFPFFVPWFVVDLALKGQRSKFRGYVVKTLPGANLDDSAAMKQLLLDELKHFQDLLKSEDQTYLVEGTKEPTAADFSVYAQLERLVGAGTASDVRIPPALQELKDDASYAKLWKWHDHMREHYPVQFLGKRPPKELLSKL
jgi:glutathione S-transferase